MRSARNSGRWGEDFATSGLRRAQSQRGLKILMPAYDFMLSFADQRLRNNGWFSKIVLAATENEREVMRSKICDKLASEYIRALLKLESKDEMELRSIYDIEKARMNIRWVAVSVLMEMEGQRMNAASVHMIEKCDAEILKPLVDQADVKRAPY